jgi:hypothetical protein
MSLKVGDRVKVRMDMKSGVDYARGFIIGVNESNADDVEYNVRADGSEDNQAQWIKSERVSAIDSVKFEEDRSTRLQF